KGRETERDVTIFELVEIGPVLFLSLCRRLERDSNPRVRGKRIRCCLSSGDAIGHVSPANLWYLPSPHCSPSSCTSGPAIGWRRRPLRQHDLDPSRHQKERIDAAHPPTHRGGPSGFDPSGFDADQRTVRHLTAPDSTPPSRTPPPPQFPPNTLPSTTLDHAKSSTGPS
ncbi:hypothetical protein chiPu_0026070, partial [Chiloscyllium punctatum]|nr:hypothetical protein [Chiloscyllium punctatum]